ncbi:MAG: hypothetical protein HP492_11375 [Nitrospira sp.]|nr:hypothetical protein [Nitrospira sp.]
MAQSAELHTGTITLGAMCMEITHYTVRQQGSILAGAYEAFSDAPESMQH